MIRRSTLAEKCRRRRTSRLFVNNLEHRIVPAGLEPPLMGPLVANVQIVGPAPTLVSGFDAAGNARIGHKSRIDDALLTIFQARKDDPAANLATTNPWMLFEATTGNPAIRVSADDINDITPKLTALGFKILGTRPDLHFVDGYLPLASLPALEPLVAQGMWSAFAIYRPFTNAGLITNQADWVHQVDRVRSLNGFDGGGERIGVLSDSFDTATGAATHAANDYASGDLSTVQVIQDAPSAGKYVATDEGRAMLQIIHDLAPNANLAFATGEYGDTNFANNILKLANPSIGNCKTIVDDLGYFVEPFFQHGVIAQAIDTVTAQGVSYFTSAGNNADQSYESTAWSEWAGLYDFDTSAAVNTKQSLTIPYNANPAMGVGLSLVFQWDDPFYNKAGDQTDLDVIIRRADTTAGVAVGQNFNIGSGNPSEFIQWTNNTGQTSFTLEISHKGGPAPGRIKWVNVSNASGPITVNTFPSTSSAVYGHAGDTNAEAVGAVPYTNPTTHESFSSKGFATTIFTPDGTSRYTTPFADGGPLIAAVDNANTSFFGGDNDGDGFPNFRGTSASAPVVAAIGALVRQRFPTWSPQQITDRLHNTATDIDAPGFDNYTGWGLVNAYKAIYGSAPTTIAEASFSDGFETGALSRAWEVDNTSTGRVKVSNVSSATGAFGVVLGSEFGEGGAQANTALSQLTLHVNAAGARNLVLNFDEREFNEVDIPMSASFPGTQNSTGVAFSVNGALWHRIVSLTGSASTNNWQSFSYDLVALAAANGVTLSSDTRIRFQDYGNRTAPNGGIAIDNVAVTRHGTVFGGLINDANGNGVINTGEIGMPGKLLFLDANDNGLLDRGTPNIYSYTGGAQPIPDMFGTTPGKLETTTFVINPNPTGPIVDVNVTINIDHDYTGDLKLYLVSPGGITVPLALNAGGQGQDMTNLTFDDGAITPIASGFGPFTGRYRPASPLSAFNGMTTTNSFGNWTLRVIDSGAFTAGTLLGWSLSLTTESDSVRLPNLAIPDYDYVPGIATDFVAVTGLAGFINDVNVNVTLNHTYDNDLRLTLISPTGVRVALADRVGGVGHNFTNTTFDDSATSYIFSNSAPFTGTFRPSEFLFKFNGLTGSAMNGYWGLEITDNVGGDVGTLVSWSLQIGTGEEFFITDPSGNYRFNNQLGEYRLVDAPVPGWRQTNFQFTGPSTLEWLSGANYPNRNYLYVADSVAPQVTAMTLLSPASSNLAAVNYQVTFSRPVYGLSTDNFQAEATGSLNGVYVSGISGSEANYVLTINTGTGGGTGTVVLDYTDSFGVTDSAFNSIVPGVIQAAQAATIDRTAPTAKSTPANVTSFGSSYGFSVTFSDNVSINIASFDGNDVRITGPGGFNVLASYSSVDINSNGTPRTATYSITPPGGSWDLTDNGTYSVTLQNGQVTDAAGNSVAAGLLGSFQVAVPAAGNFVVNNANDSGAGSLRQALLNANAQMTADTISFDSAFFAVPRTITLTLGELPITDAVSIIGPGANLMTISGNKTSRVFNVNAPGTGAIVNISGLTITGGNVGFGAGILNDGEALMLTNCVIAGNTSTSSGGAGIYLEGGSVTLEFCSIMGNSATGGGGGILSHGGGAIVVHNSTISGNKSSSVGAGVYASGNILIDASTISGNTASNGAGGGIFFFGSTAALALTVRNSTISGNSAANSGGGILAAVNGSVVLQNSTITGNSAAGGGGGLARAYSNNPITIESCIVSGNVSATAPDLSTAGTVFATFSAIGSEAGATTFTADATTTNLLGANLKLGGLANNGGPTLTHLPAPDSPLFNKGSNSTAQATDQRGVARNIGGAPDIGAVELQTSNLIVINANDSGAGSLRDALMQANGNALPDTISFDPTFFASAKTIILASGQLSITQPLAILGLGASKVIINGLGIDRVFFMDTPTSGAFISIAGVTITGGKSGNGGGMYNFDEALTLTDCVITNNTSTSGGGGILVAKTPGSLVMSRCTIANNSASVDGGGILVNGSNLTGVSLNIDDCTVSGNAAGGHGGGIHAFQKSTTVIVNSTLSGNSAGGSGGAISLGNTGDTLNLINSTITNNVATAKGGGIARLLATDAITIRSSIVSGNNNGTSPDIDTNGGSVYLSYSAVGSAIGFSFTGAKNLAFGLDVKLGPLANNGGPTMTHRPATNSPLVGAGSNYNSLTNDQRGVGYPRLIGNGIDIGAVEALLPAPRVQSVIVNGGLAQRSRVTTIAIAFDTPVNLPAGAPESAFLLQRQSDGKLVTVSANVNNGPSSTTATLTFPTFPGAFIDAGSLQDGRYTLTIFAGSAFNADGLLDGNSDGLGGDDYILVGSPATGTPKLFRLFGDSNGDGTVNGTDFLAFRLAFLSTSAVFDFDGSGQVNGTDFLQLRLRFLQGV